MRKRPNTPVLSLAELKRRGNNAMAEAEATIQQSQRIVSDANEHEAAVASGFTHGEGSPRLRQKKDL